MNPVSSSCLEKAQDLKRSRSAVFNEAQSSKVREVAASSFQACAGQEYVSRPTCIQMNIVESDALSTVNLEYLLDLFHEYRQNDNIGFEEDVSKLILQKVTVENFRRIVLFLQQQFLLNFDKPINKTILLGLAHFAGFTIADSKLYSMSRSALARKRNLLHILEFFKTDKELFPNLVLTLSFGLKPHCLGLKFVRFFNYAFSGIVKKLIFNTHTDNFSAILNKLALCPTLRVVELMLQTKYLAKDFSENIDLVAKSIKERLKNFEGVTAIFPNLSVIEIDIGVNFQDVLLEEEVKIKADIQNSIDSYFSKKPLQLPFQINTFSIYTYPYR